MSPRVLALCGGVGGAKLALGLAQIVPPDELAIVVNTGDDFAHLGLAVSPDIDTVAYTLAGLADAERGWGLAGESWAFMDALGRLGGETWFNLGDRDLATHVERTRLLGEGATLSAVTAALAARLGVAPALWPMSDDPVRTVLETDEGVLDFQRYFVGRRAEPRVSAIRYEGAEAARPSAAALAALAAPGLELVVVCPSNPWLSIAPLLAMPAFRAALSATAAPVVAVAPIIAGAAVKGPTAKLMGELGLPVTATAVADWYGDLVDRWLLDEADAALAPALAARRRQVALAPTLMRTLDDKVALARRVLAAGREMRAGR